MISYVKGPLMEQLEDRVVVEAGNLGLEIFVPASVSARLPQIGENVILYTYFQVREDAMNLYGFLTRQDREMFCQLIGVNGIGPKGALGVLSVMGPDELRLAIISEDAKAISKAPGIGVKTAQRVILDLKDKIKMEDVLPGAFADEVPAAAVPKGMAAAGKEAVDALVALGYSSSEALRAVKKVEITEDMDSEAVLKASLRHLTFL